MADNKYRSANKERRIIKKHKETQRMQGGRYETKKDGKRGRAPSQEYGRSYVIQMEKKPRLNLLRWHMICWSKNLCFI